MFAALTGSRAPEAVRRMRAEGELTGDPEFDAAFERGLEASAAEYLGWHEQCQHYRAAYRRFFRDWDVLLAPTFGVPAFPHTDAPWPERGYDVNGQRVPYTMQYAYPALATLAGQPATAFPVGLSESGLPVGLQAIGPYLEDASTIRFAVLVAEAFGGFEPPDGYASHES
jgi:amidase